MYELNSKSNIYLEAVKDVCRAAKLHNPQSLIKITESDIVEFAKDLQRKYSEKILQQARSEVLNYYADQNLTLGKLDEVCNMLSRAAQNELTTTSKYLQTPKQIQTSIAKENIAKIRAMMEEAKVIKPLPYDKTKRVYSDEGRKAGTKLQLPPQSACTFDMPIWEKTCYSDGPALYAKCVATDLITPVELVKDPELKALYTKAWTVGLEAKEKERFNELKTKMLSLYD